MTTALVFDTDNPMSIDVLLNKLVKSGLIDYEVSMISDSDGAGVLRVGHHGELAGKKPKVQMSPWEAAEVLRRAYEVAEGQQDVDFDVHQRAVLELDELGAHVYWDEADF